MTVGGFGVAEEKRYAPNSRESHKSVDYSAHNTGLTAEYPGYYVKLENTDSTPVQAAYYEQNKTNLIEHQKFLLFIFALIIDTGRSLYAREIKIKKQNQK